jgi:hypothetical protein
LTITIYDNQGYALGTFDYEIKPPFNLEKYIYNLSPSHPKATIIITTDKLINIEQRKGNKQWIHSNFVERTGQQTIKVDMSGHETDLTWWLELTSSGQK